LAIAAASLALEDANYSLKNINKKRTGVIIGTTMGERPLEESIDEWVIYGADKVNRMKIYSHPLIIFLLTFLFI